MNIKKSAKKALAEQDKRLKDLAEHLDVAPNYLSRILGGHVTLGEKRLQKMAEFFNMSVSEFIALGE